MEIISKNLKDAVNNDEKLIKLLEQSFIDIIQYKPKYNVGFSKEEYIKMHNLSNESLIDQEIVYLAYKMKLDKTFDEVR